MVSSRASSASLVTVAVVSFLKNVPPFQFLSEAELADVVPAMSLEYFPRHTVILSAGSKSSNALFVVQKGVVKLKLNTEIGDEVVLDVRSEGEMFGLLSTMGGSVARLDVVAIEDTLCYTIPWEKVQQIIGAHPQVANYFLRTSVTRYMDRTLKEIRTRATGMGDGERLLYSMSVAAAARRLPVVCGRDTTIQRAAQIMSSSAASCLFVLDSNGRAAGIVTDKDFSQKVVARALPLDTPVHHIMSAPVISVESSERVFQVLLRMLGNNIHHVLVTEAGMPKAVITNHDLMLLQGKSPLNLARHVERQSSLDDLAKAQAGLNELIPLLMREGARASHITRVIAEINDRVVSKILEFAEKECGPPPVPYCWVALGSEGRREQTFKTDQDNGLIYADPPPGIRDQVIAYFTRFTSFTRDALVRCGYPLCPGDYMASNDKWRQSLSAWKQIFTRWTTEANLLEAQDAVIFFDMRPVAGDTSLFDNLIAGVRQQLRSAGFFKSVVAFISSMHKPPVGFFRTFVVERSGEHKNQFDLKLYGTAPIVHAARLMSLDAEISRTNTFERLASLESLGYEDSDLLCEMREALEFLLMLRLERQLKQLESGEPISNYVNPESLTHLQRSSLKETFATVARAQSAVEARFKTAVWAQLG